MLYHLSKPFETRIKRPWLMEGDWVYKGNSTMFWQFFVQIHPHMVDWLSSWESPA